MNGRKRHREEELDSTTETVQSNVEEAGATPRKQRTYDNSTETGQSSAEQRGKKRKSDEETECKSPVMKRSRAAQSPAERREKKRKSDEETECKSRVMKRRRAAQSPAEQRGKKRKSDEETECKSPVKKRRRAAQSPAEQGGKKRKSDEETECKSPVMKRSRAAQSPAERREKKRKSDEETECKSRVMKRRRAAQSPAEQRGKKRKSDEETECKSPVKKRRRAAQSPAEQRGKKRKSDEEKECKSRVMKRRRAAQSPAEQRGKKRKSDEETECKSPVKKRRRAAQSPAEQRGKKRKSDEEKECKSRVKKKRISEDKKEDWRIAMYAAMEEEEEEARRQYAVGSLNVHSFIYHRILDKGNFGKVVLATYRDTGRLMVVKAVCKRLLLEYMHEDSVCVERQIMEIARGNPYCMYAYAAFETEECLYYVMDYMSGGDLSYVLNDKHKLDLTTLRLLAAELLCGLKHLHSKRVLHRDLSKRNILVDRTGHVKIADYGMSVANVYGSNMVIGCVGDPRIAAPEILSDMPYELAADYFALGILLFEAAFAEYPFTRELGQLQDPILWAEPCYPDNADPIFVGFLNKLLCKDPQMRKAEVAKIQEDPFFNGINWKEVEAGEARPPFSIRRKGFRDMTREKLPLYTVKMELSILPEDHLLFRDVSFVTEEWIAMQKLKR